MTDKGSGASINGIELVQSEYKAIKNLCGTKSKNYSVKDSHVIKLDLSRRNIANLDDSIGELTYLEELNLGDNKLERLPGSICNLKNLVKLEQFHPFESLIYLFNFFVNYKGSDIISYLK
ncbi:MAG: hypothetical protein ACTSO2_20350 [Promethearchaeota archaeon]